MTESLPPLLWRQFRERVRLLNRYPDSRPPREERRDLISRQRRERQERQQP